ncbi:hypothetical protein [Rubritalea tangerina]|uniref:Haemin-degrading HemS/ChuX domain-containing protein n=1 Tax=Rubritalea tangerina TaxID=430798 RepID=A0ABW4ZAC6_9BACT
MKCSTLKSLLHDEIWQLPTLSTPLLERLNQLHDITLMLHSNGIMSSRTVSQLSLTKLDSILTVPEAGISFQPKTLDTLSLQSGTCCHRDFSIELRHPSSPEALSIAFDDSPTNKNVLSTLVSTVTQSTPISQFPCIQDRYAPCCPCCAGKRDDIRRNSKLHPLFHIISQCTFPQEVQIKHSGLSTHSLQASSILSFSHHWGHLYLHSPEAQFAIDMTQVYNLRAQITTSENLHQSELIAYNAYGKEILSLSVGGTEHFYLWSRLLTRPAVN